MNSVPLWKQILSPNGLRLFHMTVGPSIPFLVGVYHYHHQISDDELLSDACIRKIFTEILDTASDSSVGITTCPTLDVLVIRNATLQSHNPITAANLEYNIEKAWTDYGKYIKSQRFSIDRDDHSWRPFKEETEIKWIKQLIA